MKTGKVTFNFVPLLWVTKIDERKHMNSLIAYTLQTQKT